MNAVVGQKAGDFREAGVGGGSLHFANAVIDAHEDFFRAGWPPEINFQVLAPYYQKVSDVLHPRRIPSNQLSNRTKLLKEAALLAGFAAQYDEVDLSIKFDDEYSYDAEQKPQAEHSVKTPNADGIDQGFCVHLGQCVLGCPVEARNTLALNYIPRAEKKGAEVRPLHIVRNIEPIIGGYRVHFDRIEGGKLKPGSVTGRVVVVSAGSIGSTELLLRCQKQHKSLPDFGKMLGSRWCTNANYLTPAFHDRKVYPSRGPTITAAIRFFGDNHYKGSRLMIEDGGVPDLLVAYLGDYVLRLEIRGDGDARLSLELAFRLGMPRHQPCESTISRRRRPRASRVATACWPSRASGAWDAFCD